MCRVKAYTAISCSARSCVLGVSRALLQRKAKTAWPQRDGKNDFDYCFPVSTLSSLSDLPALPASASLYMTMSEFLFVIVKVVKLWAANSHTGHLGTCW